MLNKNKLVILFVIFFAGCNLFGESRDMEIVEMRMGKTISNQGVISDLTEILMPSDEKVVLWISWNHVKGENKGTIEWDDPDGKIYFQEDFSFNAASDTWASWHELPIAKTDAALKFGDWEVFITLRGKYMGKMKFTITSTSSGNII